MGTFMSTVGNMARKIGFGVKQHAPEILTVIGIVLGVGATVTACAATVEAVEVVKDTKDKVDELDAMEKKEGELEDEKKKIKRHGAAKIASLYLPALGLTIAGAGCELYGMKVFKDEKKALAMAFAGLASEFKGYRERTKNLIGEEAETGVLYGLKSGEIVETVEDENGKTKKSKKKAALIDPNEVTCDEYSYVRIFDDTNPRWNECMEYNKTFLRSQQWVFNEMLMANGHVILNDVLYATGFRKTKAGHRTGWVYNSDDPTADNYIDFRITEIKVPITVSVEEDGKVSEEIIGYKDALMLNFNVDGSILDKIDWSY